MRTKPKAFYSVLKSADPYLRFVFLTGVATFSQVSIFSDLNKLRDIGMQRQYAGICGITEAELTANFRTELESLARENGLTYEDTLAELRKNFKGAFLRTISKVFSTSSVF
jgi:hypothetical protein